MLERRGQPGTAQIAGIENLGLSGAIGEFDSGDIQATCSPGHDRYGADSATTEQGDGFSRYRYPHDTRFFLDEARRSIELLCRKTGQGDIAVLVG